LVEAVLIGAIPKLLFNVVNSWFHNSEKKSERKYLQDVELMEHHIKLAEMNGKNYLLNLTQCICALLVMTSWCFIGIWAMIYPTETDMLIKMTPGFFAKLFNQPAEIVVPGRTPGILFQAWFEVTIAFITMFSLPAKRY
jgi:hypothetical protein